VSPFTRLALAAFVVANVGVTSVFAQQGILETATGNGLRPRLSSGQIQNFVPSRGRFTFPSPYNTTGIRLTNSSDCSGNDCVNYIGYSYWNNINNHVGSNTMLIFVGLFRSKGGPGPSLFSYDKNTGETKNLGPLFSADSNFSWESGEGWYFSGSRRTTLYMNQNGGSRMLRYDVQSHAMETVFDTRDVAPNSYIWQMHSSYDDRVHSATVRNSSSYEMLGCVAYREDQRKAYYFPKKGDYDECQIDKSGRYLLIKENVDGADGEDNRIIDLNNGTEKVFLDRDGAAGHSDMGFGYFLAEDNFYPRPGAARVWRMGDSMSSGGQGRLVYEITDWAADLGHVSHSSAQNGLPLEKQTACVSNANRQNLPRVNEIVCFRLDDSETALVVAPNMVDLNAAGGGGGDYEKRPKGNLDVTGEYFIWTANMGGGRLDAFMVHIPKERLVQGAGSPPPPSDPSPSPAPSEPPAESTPSSDFVCCPHRPGSSQGGNTPSPPPPPPNQPAPPPPGSSQGVSWMSLINVTANGNNVQKTGGCDGCPDASAVSNQQVSNGSLTFVASDTGALRFIGLSGGGAGTQPGDIRFAIRLQGGTAEVRESGGYKSEISFNAGDTFRIVVEGGVVKYLKNGSVFYTSGSSSGGQAMRAHVVLFNMNAAVNGITIG
jgi:hypothetical protein